MGIPKIQSYAMPGSSELPENRVAWKPEPSRAVLLIHDMQEYFLDYYDTKASPVVEMVANIRALREKSVALGIPVIYTKQPAEQSSKQRGLLNDLWGPGLTAHPQREAIVNDLAPQSTDSVLTKWRYSAFQRTELLDLMQQWNRDQMIICGVYAHIGCLMTACEAFMNDVQPFFVSDATSDFSSELHRMAIKYVAERCGVTMTTRDVVYSLESRAHVSIPPRPTLPSAVDAVQPSKLSLELLRSELSDLLQQPASTIPDQEELLDLGLDSIRLMTLVERLRGTGIEVTFVELAERPTLAAWWDLLSTRVPNQARAY